MIVAKIDENGYFLKDIILQEGEEAPLYCIETRPNTEIRGFYRPKWTGTEWIEGMTQEEINELNNQPKELSVEERLALAEDTINFLLGL